MDYNQPMWQHRHDWTRCSTRLCDNDLSKHASFVIELKAQIGTIVETENDAMGIKFIAEDVGSQYGFPIRAGLKYVLQAYS